jgi:prepilin-type N-terminal cleavage/methylation domain-containing protein
MNSAGKTHRQQGFSLLELLTAAAIFLVLCAVAFGLLEFSQKRYQTESQVLNSFQEARFGLDQIVRDVNDSGYPPPSHFDFAVPPPANFYASSAIAWAPRYPNTPCAVGGGCSTPGDFDLIVETDVDPQNNNGVEWVRYQLQGTTLFRGLASKVAGGDPDGTTAPTLVPYVRNVMNNASAGQIAQFQASYSRMYPGGNPVPIFSYTCDTPSGPQPCSLAGSSNAPANIRDVEITLIVKAPVPDAQTGQTRLVELRGRGHRINPNQ